MYGLISLTFQLPKSPHSTRENSYNDLKIQNDRDTQDEICIYRIWLFTDAAFCRQLQ
jgi:hypothetical protein